MFQGNGGIGLAFGLMGGFVLAILVFIWLSAGLPNWWHHDGSIVTSSDSLANWITSVVGIVATLVSIWAVILLNHTLLQTAAATKAAQEAVAVTRSIGEKQVRAYVYATNFKAKSFAVGEHPEFTLDFRNSGQSPARKCRVRASVFLGVGSGDHTKIRIPDPGRAYSRSEIAAGDNSGILRRWDTPLSAQQLDLLQKGFLTFVIAGHLTYHDVFGKTHRMTFMLNTTGIAPSDGSGAFRYCGRGNKSN